MLLQNTNQFASMPITLTGGTLAGEFVFLGIRDQTFLNLNTSFSARSGIPSGYSANDSWHPPLKAGEIGAGGDVDSSGLANLAAGINAEAAVSSDLVISNAALVGVASIAASATTSLTTSASATAVVLMSASSASSLNAGSASLSAAASITASGSFALSQVTAEMKLAPVSMQASSSFTLASIASAVGFADLQATATNSLVGVATVTANGFMVASQLIAVTGSAVQSANAFMIASAGGPEALSPEGLAAAVWRSSAIAYNDSGTMGAKLNSASSAGDPWGTAVPASYPVGTAGWLIGQLALENPSIAVQLDEVWKRLGLDPNNPLVNSEDYISAGPVVIEVTRDSASTTTTRMT